MNGPTAALRDLLTCRLRSHDRPLRSHDRRLRRFTAPQWRRYGDLLAGALLVAVRRRFVAGQDRAPVIRFVAAARERYDPTGRDVDPVCAEARIWAAFGEQPPVPDDPAAVVARTVLPLGLLEDEGLFPAELDAFLTAAETGAGAETAADTDTAIGTETGAGTDTGVGAAGPADCG